MLISIELPGGRSILINIKGISCSNTITLDFVKCYGESNVLLSVLNIISSK